MFKNLNYKFGNFYLTLKIFAKIVPWYLYGRVFLNTFKNILCCHSPSSAILALTYRCQCRCVHCSAGLYKKEKESELATEEWYRLLEQISELGVPRINFTGGEALLRKDIFEIIRYATKKFVVILESNGLLLTDENVRQLKKARISAIAVSLDSYDPLAHDALRNLNGCFQKAIEGISNITKHKIPCFLSTYVTPEKVTRDYLRKIITLAKQSGVLAVRILPPRPAGSFACQTESLLRKQDEQKLLKIIDSRIAYFKGIPAPRQCGVFCKATFYISPYGEVQLCPYLSFSFGKVNANSLPQILNKMWKHKIFDTKQKDCLILNEEFRNKIIAPYLKTMQEEIIFPIEV